MYLIQFDMNEEAVLVEYPDFIVDLFETTEQDDMNYVYRGYFTQSITDSILQLTERNLEVTSDPTKIKRRVYFLMVESLQNITRYQSSDLLSLERSAIFTIQKKGNFYFITTGNLIDNPKIEYVRKQLEQVNGLEQEELKQYYKKILKNGRFTNEGGAGLGLIEMARKSGNKLAFDFKKINESCSYFYNHTVIPSYGEVLAIEELQESLKGIVDLHEHLNHTRIVLIFNSGFSQESLLNLIQVIERQLADLGAQRKKFFHVMIEMVQNIIHHATNHQGDELMKSGIFYIKEKEHFFSLNAGNLILNEEVEHFKGKLDKINGLSHEELESLYNARLLDFKNTTNKKTGLGIIDLRMKSDNLLEYDFKKVNDKYTFFTLQIEIEKTTEAQPS